LPNITIELVYASVERDNEMSIEVWNQVLVQLLIGQISNRDEWYNVTSV
jgi:hypothetical protein